MRNSGCGLWIQSMCQNLKGTALLLSHLRYVFYQINKSVTVLINLWKGGWWNLDPPKSKENLQYASPEPPRAYCGSHPKQQLKWFQQRAVYNFHMLSMRYVIEEIKRLNKEFTICFVDFHLRWWNPFSSVKWTLWDALCYLWLIICSLIFVFVLQFSKELTGVFVQMGQSPVLKVKVGHRFVSWDEWKIFNKSYITNEGWETTQDISH